MESTPLTTAQNILDVCSSSRWHNQNVNLECKQAVALATAFVELSKDPDGYVKRLEALLDEAYTELAKDPSRVKASITL